MVAVGPERVESHRGEGTRACTFVYVMRRYCDVRSLRARCRERAPRPPHQSADRPVIARGVFVGASARPAARRPAPAASRASATVLSLSGERSQRRSGLDFPVLVAVAGPVEENEAGGRCDADGERWAQHERDEVQHETKHAGDLVLIHCLGLLANHEQRPAGKKGGGDGGAAAAQRRARLSFVSRSVFFCWFLGSFSFLLYLC